MIGGSWVEEPNTVKEAVHNFFESRFSEPDYDRPEINGAHFRTIGQQQNAMLVKHPQAFNGFGPISLIGCVYKIVAKILANRLKKVLSNVIDERQTAFLKGRHMLHGVLIANEVMEEAKRCKKPCLVFKVDYEKAYDSLS